jgi:hypothetical protein
MVSIPTSPTDLDPVTARKTWRTVEPMHGMIYFAPEAGASYAGLGLRAESGYFASRSAPMGAVAATTVIATFFNFHPDLVTKAMGGLWETVTPEDVLVARLEAADRSLRRMLGDAVDSPEMARAAGLAREAAQRATGLCAGRPLFAGHAHLDWPDSPHTVLWHAQTLLREFRGDGHIAALVLHQLDPIEALVMHVASGDVPAAFLRTTRGWSDAEWSEGASRLVERGWLLPMVDGADTFTLSEAGAGVHQDIEDMTDQLATPPYQAIGEEGCAELRSLVRPFSVAVVEAAGFGV